jgi:hypothetical protein
VTGLRTVPLELYTVRPDIIAAMPSWERPDDVLVGAVDDVATAWLARKRAEAVSA